MGFWGCVQSATDALRRLTPGTDSVKDACRTSYDYATSAAGTIGATAAAGAEKARIKDAYRHAWNYASRAASAADRAVRVEASRRIAEWTPEAEQRRQMLQVLRKVGISAADIAVSETARCIPGGPPLYRVIKEGAAEIARIQREGRSKPSGAGHLDGGAGPGEAAASAVEGSQPPWAAGIQRPEDVIGLLLREGLRAGPSWTPCSSPSRQPATVGGGDPEAGGRDRAALAAGFESRALLDALLVPVPRGWRPGWGFAGENLRLWELNASYRMLLMMLMMKK